MIILLALASRVEVLIWSFISEGRFSIILRISLVSVRESLEDEDGSVIGYTHKGLRNNCGIKDWRFLGKIISD